MPSVSKALCLSLTTTKRGVWWVKKKGREGKEREGGKERQGGGEREICGDRNHDSGVG